MSARTVSAKLPIAVFLTSQTGDAAMDDSIDAVKTTGADVRQTTLASGVTTNTTSSTSTLPAGNKTFFGIVTGTGAVTQTQQIYGNYTNSTSNGVLLATITLSGTTTAVDATAVSAAAYSYYYVVTTNTTGTSATGAVYAMY